MTTIKSHAWEPGSLESEMQSLLSAVRLFAKPDGAVKEPPKRTAYQIIDDHEQQHLEKRAMERFNRPVNALAMGELKALMAEPDFIKIGKVGKKFIDDHGAEIAPWRS